MDYHLIKLLRYVLNVDFIKPSGTSKTPGNESGGPMDFINALRFLEDEYQEFLKDPEGYQGCPDEQPENVNPPSGSSADDLPF